MSIEYYALKLCYPMFNTVLSVIPSFQDSGRNLEACNSGHQAYSAVLREGKLDSRLPGNGNLNRIYRQIPGLNAHFRKKRSGWASNETQADFHWLVSITGFSQWSGS